MTIKFKNTTNNIELKNILKEFTVNKDEIVDLTNLNLFEATKSIIMISTYVFQKDPTKKIRYKVSTPNIRNLINEIPLSNRMEFIEI